MDALARFLPILLVATLATACAGPTKTLIINSDPPGADVWVNGEKLEGQTPVRVPFEWYGMFEVRLEKEGYESLATEVQVPTELDGYPVIDLVLLPFAGDKTFPRNLKMTPLGQQAAEAEIDRVRSRAETFRGRTLQEIREPGTPAPDPEGPGGR